MNKNRFALALLLILSLGFVLSGLAQQKADDTAIDPVCGMTVKKAEAKATFDYKGTTYYFCGAGCKEAFAKDPEKYIQKKEEATPSKPATCPGSGKEMPAQTAPHGRMMGKCPAMQHEHGQMAGSAAGMSCPLQSKDVERKTENLPDGAAVKFTSKNPETVKKIQEHLANMKGCCCAGGCQAQQDVKK
jgi:YHS domain-containing protein/TusA-related sulfurtransferase